MHRTMQLYVEGSCLQEGRSRTILVQVHRPRYSVWSHDQTVWLTLQSCETQEWQLPEQAHDQIRS